MSTKHKEALAAARRLSFDKVTDVCTVAEDIRQSLQCLEPILADHASSLEFLNDLDLKEERASSQEINKDARVAIDRIAAICKAMMEEKS